MIERVAKIRQMDDAALSDDTGETAVAAPVVDQ
jgi:hypothetical protein